jgi:hypothetical protein
VVALVASQAYRWRRPPPSLIPVGLKPERRKHARKYAKSDAMSKR